MSGISRACMHMHILGSVYGSLLRARPEFCESFDDLTHPCLSMQVALAALKAISTEVCSVRSMCIRTTVCPHDAVIVPCSKYEFHNNVSPHFMCLFHIMESHIFMSMIDFNNIGGDSSANNGHRFSTNGIGNGMFFSYVWSHFSARAHVHVR